MSQDNEDDLKKNLKGALAGAALSVASMVPGKAAAESKPNLDTAFKRATSSLFHKEAEPVFKPETLHPEMHAIAHIETSYGKNMKHSSHSGGVFDTAFGPLGFKPSSAHDELSKNKHLSEIYPHLTDKLAFNKEFQSNPDFYNLIAGKHWESLKKKTAKITGKESASNAAYAWRWGANKFAEDFKKDPNIIKKDSYVQKYNSLNEQRPWAKTQTKPTELALNKVETFRKWPVGPSLPSQGGAKMYNYNHMLEPHHLSDMYEARVGEDHVKGAKEVTAAIRHPLSRSAVASVSGYVDPDTNKFYLELAHIEGKRHTGKGLGRKLYEILYSHLKNNLGVSTVVGDVHSSSASKAQKFIGDRYGTGYTPVKNIGTARYPDEQTWETEPNRPFDDKYKKYKIVLKDEMALNKAVLRDHLTHFGSNVSVPEPVDYSKLPKSPHVEGQTEFENHVNSTTQNFPPTETKAQGHGALKGFSAKSIYNINGNRYIVKPASSKSFNYTFHEGLAESMSQSLYHAAGLGHLMQKSHISHMTAQDDPKKTPFHGLVIHAEPNVESYSEVNDKMPKNDPKSNSKTFLQIPNLKNQMNNIAMMDFLTMNPDRHGENIMVRKDQNGMPSGLLAIDHGNSFTSDIPLSKPHQEEKIGRYSEYPGDPFYETSYHLGSNKSQDWKPIVQNIAEKSALLQKAIKDHTDHVKDPVQKQRLESVFDRRLNSIVKLHDLLKDGHIDNLAKRVDDLSVEDIERLHDKIYGTKK